MDVAIGLGIIGVIAGIVIWLIWTILKIAFFIVTLPFRLIALIFKKEEPRTYTPAYPRPKGGTIREIRAREKQERREEKRAAHEAFVEHLEEQRRINTPPGRDVGS